MSTADIHAACLQLLKPTACTLHDYNVSRPAVSNLLSTTYFVLTVLFVQLFLHMCGMLSLLTGKWTWAATLLQSSNVAYKFGVAGPFWYASGMYVQEILCVEARKTLAACDGMDALSRCRSILHPEAC